VDVFCEPSSAHAFDAEESRAVLEAGRAGRRRGGGRAGRRRELGGVGGQLQGWPVAVFFTAGRPSLPKISA